MRWLTNGQKLGRQLRGAEDPHKAFHSTCLLQEFLLKKKHSWSSGSIRSQWVVISIIVCMAFVFFPSAPLIAKSAAIFYVTSFTDNCSHVITMCGGCQEMGETWYKEGMPKTKGQKENKSEWNWWRILGTLTLMLLQKPIINAAAKEGTVLDLVCASWPSTICEELWNLHQLAIFTERKNRGRIGLHEGEGQEILHGMTVCLWLCLCVEVFQGDCGKGWQCL